MNNKTEIIFVKNEQRESSLANLKELLSYKFIIPFFQRPYSWDSDHFKDLLETIKDNKSKDREAFLGSIIVALKKIRGSSVPGQQEYFLIDGQQRITSFLLLLKLISNELKNLTEKQTKYIQEKTELLNKAKSKKDIEDIEKYVNQKRDEESKKVDYEKHLKKIKQKLEQDRIKRESHSSEEFEQDVLKYIFNDENNLKNKELIKMKDTFEQEIQDIDIIDFLNYVLNKCIFCFLTIEGDDSEDYAIDIFNSLNSTGEPLTAFEILKSLIHKHFKDNINLQQDLTKKFNKIEEELDKKRIKKVTQNKYTDRLLIFINMMNEKLHLEKLSTFRDKKKLLDKLLTLRESNIKHCIETIYALHEFILHNWKNKKPNIIDDLEPEVQIMFNFLQSINHNRIIPVLYKFKDSKRDLNDAIKLCVAFTCLWRGYSTDGGTDRIDNQYEKIIKILFQEEHTIQSLKNKIIQLLEERDRHSKLNREEWINKFKNIDIYKQKTFARFLLYIAFNKRDFNDNTQSLNESKLTFLRTLTDWLSKDYKTIEHITPQGYKSVDKIGNLILLPQNINSKVGKKNFLDKKEVYEDCINKSPNEMPYIPVLKEIASYGKVNDLDDNQYLKDEVIISRGEKLGNSIWQTLAEDWLGWKD